MADLSGKPYVCYVADYSILIGGKERQLLEILKYLKQNHIAFNFVSLSSAGLLYQNVKQSYEDELFLIERKSIGLIDAMLRLRKYIKENDNIRIYHTFDSLSALCLIIASAFLPVKIINGSTRHAGVAKWKDYIYDFILLQLSDVIIANSYAGLRYFFIRKGYVNYNAIDPSRFRTTSGALTKVIMVANFSDYKDHQTFFTATLELLKNGQLEKAGLVGDGKYLEKWKRYVRKIGLEEKYEFYGHCPKVEQILTEYGTGILCSTKKYKEGISNSILEYMSSGLVVIASDIVATNEIIADKENGRLFKVEDPDDLKDKISQTHADEQKCREMIQNASRTLSEKFDFTTNMQKLVSLYNSLLQ